MEQTQGKPWPDKNGCRESLYEGRQVIFCTDLKVQVFALISVVMLQSYSRGIFTEILHARV